MTTSAPLTAERVHALLGERFEIRDELGRGGQGVVFRATRRAIASGASANDDVALKVHLDPLEDERVVREIGVMEALQHRTLAKLLEHGTVPVDGHAVRFIAWEYIDGQPLSLRIAAGPVPPKAVAVVGRDAAEAITKIWSKQVVHRDVNPKNVMLRAGNERAVLIDLGAARHLTQQTLTATGYTWGTPGYMSPEQFAGGQELTCLSDIYSLGLTMLEALTARHPTARRQDLLSTAPFSAVALAPDAPPALTALIDRMMAKRAAARPRPDQVADEAGTLAAQL